MDGKSSINVDNSSSKTMTRAGRVVTPTEKARSRMEASVVSEADSSVSPGQSKRKLNGMTLTVRNRRPRSVEPLMTASATSPKKRKRDEPVDFLGDLFHDEDETFLQAAKKQLKRTKTDDNSNEEILEFLDVIKKPASEDIQYSLYRCNDTELVNPETTDAYILSIEDARMLIGSNVQIEVPVFVPDGANTTGVLKCASQKRPIEQMFDWFSDGSQAFEGRVGSYQATKTVNQLMTRFQNNGPVTDGPAWNFADLAFPFTLGIPSFVHQPSCNLLRDIVRYLLNNATNGKLCTDTCANRKKAGRSCSKHLLTVAQYDEIQSDWRNWQGTVMMAEAGALTTCHSDRSGFGTHISCLEGEMGFGYLPRPTREDLKDVRAIKPDGRWRYQVLRTGDALYMGPGTPHLVFRLPDGDQTLGLAAHVVRGVDAERWVERLIAEALDDDYDTPELLRALTVGLRWAHDKLMSQKRSQQMYGGKAQIAKFGRALKRLERVADKLPLVLAESEKV